MPKLFTVFFICLFFNHISFANFIAGTLIHTPNGYIPIEKLQENDLVFSYDFKQASIVQNKITNHITVKNNTFIGLSINNNILKLSPSQKLYCLLNPTDLASADWIAAKNIKKGQLIFFRSGFTEVNDIVEINKNEYMYDLSIEHNHNFFVSMDKILVHNFVPVLVWAAGEGISLCWVGIGIVASYIGLKSYKNHQNGDFIFKTPNQNDMNHFFNNPGHNFNGKDPKDIIDKIIEILEQAFKKGRLQNNYRYEEYTMLSTHEMLVARGKVVDGITHLGTTFIKIITS